MIKCLQVRRKYDDDIRKCLQYVVTKCYVGDWFVLCQLAKNCNPYFFREFVRELARELKTRPKMSAKSRSNLNAGDTLIKQKSTII